MSNVGQVGPPLEVVELSVGTGAGLLVDPTSFTLRSGEILGVVGESGSGKTTLALALLGHARAGARIVGGRVLVGGVDIVAATPADRRRLRGNTIAYVPQDPSQALNPSMRVGAAIGEQLRTHDWPGPRLERIAEVLRTVRLPTGSDFAARYPHQLSGGQQQRLALAIALAASPSVLVLDEPTTGLDVVVEAEILAEVRRLRDETGVAVVHISHDIAVVEAVADRVSVMYAGSIVETAPAPAVLGRPRHPYTQGLIAAAPDGQLGGHLAPIPGAAVRPTERPPGCAFAPRCPAVTDSCRAVRPSPVICGEEHSVRCLHVEDALQGSRSQAVQPPRALEDDPGDAVLVASDVTVRYGKGDRAVVAVDRVSLSVPPGGVMAIVGGSGSGKSSFVRAVAGLQAQVGGALRFGGAPLPLDIADRSWEQVRGMQLVAQQPGASLNPRHSVGAVIRRHLRVLRDADGESAERRLAEVLDLVRLPRDIAAEYPRALSGGELQRVALARALSVRPRLLLLDEVTSALDVSVQAAVIELLRDVRDELGCAMVLVTHDLGVVASLADRIAVMHEGRQVEMGAVAQVLRSPADTYTRALLDARGIADAEGR